MKKIAVIGANGYLGKHLIHFLRTQNDDEITGFDLSAQPYFSGSSYHSLDIAQPDAFENVKLDFDTIYFFSGLTGTVNSLDAYESFIDVNEKGLLNLLTAMRTQNSRAKIIFPSTRLVYKGIKNTPLGEDSEKEFKTIYASSKYNGELYLAMYRNYFGLDYSVFRICVPYGNLFDSSFSYGTTGFFITQASQGKDISLYGDGQLKRTFSYVEDICRQIVRTGEHPASSGQTYNVGGETLSLTEVAETIAARYGVGVRYVDWPELALKSESGDTIFDSTKIEQVLGVNSVATLSQWFKSLEINA